MSDNESSEPVRSYYLHVSGPSFSPMAASARCAVAFVSRQEPGAPRKTGPHRGAPAPFGRGHLVGPSQAYMPPELVLAFLGLVERIKPILEELGADAMSIHYDVEYRGQCNMEWSTAELVALSRLAIPFTVSCRVQEPEPERPTGPVTQ